MKVKRHGDLAVTQLRTSRIRVAIHLEAVEEDLAVGVSINEVLGFPVDGFVRSRPFWSSSEPQCART